MAMAIGWLINAMKALAGRARDVNEANKGITGKLEDAGYIIKEEKRPREPLHDQRLRQICRTCERFTGLCPTKPF
jgi:hypothetical protein